MNIAAIVLAAGASTRLGYAKQLVLLSGETLLDRTIRIARDAGCDPILVVLGSNADVIKKRCALHGAIILHNEHWQQGMSSSLRVGLEHEAHASGALILTCDMPAVTADHLRTLIATETLTASHYAQRNGVPAFFPAAVFSQLMALHGDAGARTLLQAAPGIALPGGDMDIDTPQDVLRMKEIFEA